MDYYLLRWELNRKQLKYVTLTGLGKPSEYTLNLFMALYEVKPPKKLSEFVVSKENASIGEVYHILSHTVYLYPNSDCNLIEENNLNP